MKAQDNYYKGVGKRIKEARKTTGSTQEQLGKVLRVSRISVVHYEAGKQRPSLWSVKKIARNLNADLCWLITGRRA